MTPTEQTDAEFFSGFARATMLAALKWAEAVMSIVEPRSDKAEYLECLQAVRTAIRLENEADDRLEAASKATGAQS